MPEASPPRVVLVWRNDVLHGSETFIRNQVDATRGWRAILGGARRWESALSAPTDEILFGSAPIERVRRRLFLMTGRSSRLDRLIRTQRVSLVHAHFATSATAVAGTARRLGLPFVVTVHGFDVTNHAMRRGRRGARDARRMRQALQAASRVVAVSDFIATQTITAFGVDPERIRVLPIGVPVRPSPAPVRVTRDLAFVGRLVDKKGVPDLLAALSLLAGRGLRPSLAIVGEGPMRAALEEEAASRGLSVEFLGHLPPDDVAQVLRESRVFVAPSRTASNGDAEGFGMVYLEAALAGIPAIAYRHGGVPEAIVDGVTGLLADEGDIEGLAASIETLLADTDVRAEMGRAAEARVRAEFDIRPRTDALVALYDEVSTEAAATPAGVSDA
ncbi:glycosyltransferase [Microbacterium sp. NPDC056044]|uniref:glycosyltransferase n=1 Tax=Microbacterium sp. NPDC056044 TaxID=3345690 RepID=UPI0035E1D511